MELFQETKIRVKEKDTHNPRERLPLGMGLDFRSHKPTDVQIMLVYTPMRFLIN